jgi:hypothetical protein
MALKSIGVFVDATSEGEKRVDYARERRMGFEGKLVRPRRLRVRRQFLEVASHLDIQRLEFVADDLDGDAKLGDLVDVLEPILELGSIVVDDGQGDRASSRSTPSFRRSSAFTNAAYFDLNSDSISDRRWSTRPRTDARAGQIVNNAPVRTENLNPTIVVMKAAQNGA